MSLDALKQSLQQMAGQFGGSAASVLRAADGLRGSTAGTLEAAIAGAAAAAAAVRLEAALALAPRLPGATGPTVCEEIEALHEELTEHLPQAVLATVLAGDPRALPALFALLAQDEDIAALQQDAQANAGSLLGTASSFASRLQQATTQGPLQVSAFLNRLTRQGAEADSDPDLPLAPAALRVLGGSVQRVQAAARLGARGVYEQTLQLARKLQVGHAARVFTGRQGKAISLERDYAGVVAGSYVLLDRQDYREIYKVQTVAQGARAEFALQGKSSFLGLAGANLSSFADRVRETTVYARSEPLTPARSPLLSAVAGDSLQVAANLSGMLAGRRLLIKGLAVDDGRALVHACSVVSATPAAISADGGTLVFSPPLPCALQRASVVVYGNVAQAGHGESVTQVLGSGDAAQAHQRFELKHAPLTQRAAATETGVQAELDLRVGDLQWQARSTLFGAGAEARVYTLRSDEQSRVWLQFGDGQQGARLPSAANNLRLRYRKGLGAAGNVRAEALTQALSRPLGFKGVSNPAAASGGSDAEDASTARRSMPLGTRTLGRAVSVLDYEDFARAFAGIAKAQARVVKLPQGPVVAITLAGAAGVALAADNPLCTHLLGALKVSGDPHVQVRLLSHQARLFQLGLKVRCAAERDPALVLAAVEAALRAAFGFDARALGQPVASSEVISVAHSVPGVLALDLDFLCLRGLPPSLQANLVAELTRNAGGAAAPAALLTLDPGPLLRLETMP